jgi:hypothetical protein
MVCELNERRTAILQILGLAAGLLKPCCDSQTYASASQLKTATPPKEITANIHGRKIRLKHDSLKSAEDAALFGQLWFLHLTYGLDLSQEFVADETGMEVRTIGGGITREYRVSPFSRGIELTETSQASVILLASAILGVVTQGDGFTIPRDRFPPNPFRLGNAGKDVSPHAIELCKAMARLWHAKAERGGDVRQARQDIIDARGLLGANFVGSEGRLDAVLDWMTPISPSERDLQRNPLLKTVLQTLLDFCRWQFNWTEIYTVMEGHATRGAWAGRTVELYYDPRQGSRWFALGAAFKCLMGEQKLPSVRIVLDSRETHQCLIVLSGTGKSFVTFPASTFLRPADSERLLPDFATMENSQRLHEFSPSLGDGWDLPVHAIVASLGLKASGKRRDEFIKATRCEFHDSIDSITTPESIVMMDANRDPAGASTCVSEDDWRIFSHWSTLKI